MAYGRLVLLHNTDRLPMQRMCKTLHQVISAAPETFQRWPSCLGHACKPAEAGHHCQNHQRRQHLPQAYQVQWRMPERSMQHGSRIETAHIVNYNHV
jgi:hypothetical protein